VFRHLLTYLLIYLLPIYLFSYTEYIIDSNGHGILLGPAHHGNSKNI